MRKFFMIYSLLLIIQMFTHCIAQEFYKIYTRQPDSTYFVLFKDYQWGYDFNKTNWIEKFRYNNSIVELNYQGHKKIYVTQYSSPVDTLKIYGWYSLQYNNKTDTVVFYKGIDEYDTIVPVFDAVKTGEWKYYNKKRKLIKKEIYTNGKLDFSLENVYFMTDSYALTTESNIKLNQWYDYLDKNPNFKIDILGHTDNVGDDKYNQTLSENRAKAVADYLILKGISANRITLKGYSYTNPMIDNSTAEVRKKNRRVEIKIIE